MTRTTLTTLLVASFLAAGAATSEAQRAHFGPHVGYSIDFEDAFIGAQVGIPISPELELYPSASYYLTEVGTLLGFNGDVKWRLPTRSRLKLYVGGGLNVLRRSGGGFGSDSDIGVNILGGLETQAGNVHPFVEGRFLLHDNTTFQFLGGLNITLY